MKANKARFFFLQDGILHATIPAALCELSILRYLDNYNYDAFINFDKAE